MIIPLTMLVGCPACGGAFEADLETLRGVCDCGRTWQVETEGDYYDGRWHVIEGCTEVT